MDRAETRASRPIDLARYAARARKAAVPHTEGRLTEVVGLVMAARGCRAAIGDLFELGERGSGSVVRAEVVGLRGEQTLMMPLDEIDGLAVGTPVRRIGASRTVDAGPAYIGRVIDALGKPLDGMPDPAVTMQVPLYGYPINPLKKQPVDTPLAAGVRAIDSLLTLGRGQRIGIFAGGGVGKSSLLGMLVRNSNADVVVVGLVGERGREVEHFVNQTLGKEGLARSVVVAATGATPPLQRVRGALLATSMAEYFRAQGKHVLLVMDSVTRYAMALREVGLAIGEPPTTKGYTPSVFAALPRLFERAGTDTGQGSITGVYTVLVEGDDLNDPIGDAVRAIVDGHIVLSRHLAERGHFPAIDVAQSVSRVMDQVVPPEHIEIALKARALLATYREAEDLLAIGAYKPGSLSHLDEAIERMPGLTTFLKQRSAEPSTMPESVNKLAELCGLQRAATPAKPAAPAKPAKPAPKAKP